MDFTKTFRSAHPKQHLEWFRNFARFTVVINTHRQTERQTNRETDKQTDHRTSVTGRINRQQLQFGITDTHTHPFNSPLSRATGVGWYQKGKTCLDFTEARDSEW